MAETATREVYLTLHEAAALEGVCYQTIWRYVKRAEDGDPGGLHATRRGINGHWRIAESDYYAWSHKHNGQPGR